LLCAFMPVVAPRFASAGQHDLKAGTPERSVCCTSMHLPTYCVSLHCLFRASWCLFLCAMLHDVRTVESPSGMVRARCCSPTSSRAW
jgi:hypothetical protein